MIAKTYKLKFYTEIKIDFAKKKNIKSFKKFTFPNSILTH